MIGMLLSVCCTGHRRDCRDAVCAVLLLCYVVNVAILSDTCGARSFIWPGSAVASGVRAIDCRRKNMANCHPTARTSCFKALHLGCRTGFIFGLRQQIRQRIPCSPTSCTEPAAHICLAPYHNVAATQQIRFAPGYGRYRLRLAISPVFFQLSRGVSVPPSAHGRRGRRILRLHGGEAFAPCT